MHEFLARERVARAQDLLRGTPALTLKEISSFSSHHEAA
jgi:hypothetical protein